ncbi:MAG: RNA polymerase sigma factor [Ilumatobacteraceae bacterium]
MGHASDADHAATLLSLYDESLPQVYGFVLHRCRHAATAEDLTAETYMAAVESIRRAAVHEVTTAWLIGIARHKIVDHWRRTARESVDHGHDVGTGTAGTASTDDPWDRRLDDFLARDVLDQLGDHHRSALTLRYVDDLPVAEVADVLGRTLHATEALLVRARLAFRTRYEQLQDEETR